MVVKITIYSQISTVISMVIIDIHPVYGMLLGREWINARGELINSRMDTIAFPHHRDLITLPREGKYKEKIYDRED